MTNKKYFSKIPLSQTILAGFFLCAMGIGITLFLGFDSCPSLNSLNKIKCYVGNVAAISCIILGIYVLINTLLRVLSHKLNDPILIVGSSYLEFQSYKIPLIDIKSFYVGIFDILHITTTHPAKKYLTKGVGCNYFLQIFANITSLLSKIYMPLLIIIGGKTKMNVSYNITLFSKHIISQEEFEEISVVLGKQSKK